MLIDYEVMSNFGGYLEQLPQSQLKWTKPFPGPPEELDEAWKTNGPTDNCDEILPPFPQTCSISQVSNRRMA